MNSDVVIFVLYLLILLGIGLFFSRKASLSSESYLLGGRDIGPAATALTMQSTSMSGFMFLGGPALAFQHGWFAIFYAIGDAGGGIINLSVLGKRMRRMSERFGALSPIEYLEKRYESAAIRVVGSIIATIFLFAYVFAQFLAAGKALESLTGWKYEWAVVIGVGIIVVYTVAGGYLAVVWTDFFQALVMLVGVALLVIVGLFYVGGLSGLNESMGEIDASYLSIWGKDYVYYGQWGVILGSSLIYMIGYMGLPHVVVRHMSMKSTKTVKTATLWTTVYNQLFAYAPYLLGFMGIVLLPNLSDPEMVIPTLAYTFFPGIFAALILSAVMAAIMSTSDSILMQAGTILSRDVYQRFIDKGASQNKLILVSRLSILLAGVIGIVVAVVQPPKVFDLVIFAFGTMGNAFLVPYVAAVYWRNANKVGVLSAMIAGSVTNVLWESFAWQDVTGFHPFLAGLLVSIIAMVIGNQFGTPPSESVQKVFDESTNAAQLPKNIEQHANRDIGPEARTIGEFIKTDALVKG